MSKSNYLETQILKAVLRGEALDFDADDTLYIAFHSSDPGEGGTQDTNEIAYTGYARVALARDTSGSAMAVSGDTASNQLAVSFPPCTAGSATATHISIGRASSGAGDILYSSALAAPLDISAGITPVAGIGAITVTEG